MTLDLQEVARAMGGVSRLPDRKISGWSVDSRTQRPGDAYFALRGPNHDGHDFARAAAEHGAAAVVVERPMGAPNEVLVHNTLRALQDAAAWARTQWGGTVIGVTGSAGKTTTKDAIAHLLSADREVGCTIGNFNNEVGLPLSILRLPDGCRVAVLEMGMNHAGEIRALARIALPDIGVVTNVGYAHVEFFEGIEGVAAAKRELIEALPAEGVAVLNADDARVLGFRELHPGRTVTFGFSPEADVRVEDVCESGAITRFRAAGVEFETSLAGRHAVMNLLAAIAVAGLFNIPPERLRDAVRSFSAGERRGRRLEHNGVAIWDDTYNSNPEAVQSMIDVLRETRARRRFAALGEMRELGAASDKLHRQVGRYAAGHGVDVLIGVGAGARAMVEAALESGMSASQVEFFDDASSAGEFLREAACPGDAVLFKGSRGVHMERAIERFTA